MSWADDMLAQKRAELARATDDVERKTNALEAAQRLRAEIQQAVTELQAFIQSRRPPTGGAT